MQTHLSPLLRTTLAACAAAALAACSSMSGSRSGGGDSSATTTDVVLLANADMASAQLQNGCWATFYDERNFGGSSLTLVGPAEVQTLDKGTAQQLRRDIKSIVTGPKATLTLYDKQFLSARNVPFGPGSREASVIEPLGPGGRIESLRLRCRE